MIFFKETYLTVYIHIGCLGNCNQNKTNWVFFVISHVTNTVLATSAPTVIPRGNAGGDSKSCL